MTASEITVCTWAPRVVFAAAFVVALHGDWMICALQLVIATLMHLGLQRLLAANRQRLGE
jgi:hypothetical protein